MRLPAFAEGFHANLVAAGSKIIAGYRSSSEADISRFDWARARRCLLYALQIEPADKITQGKLHLSDGYLNYEANPKGTKVYGSINEFRRAGLLLPASPDPHLALAKVYVYGLHNAAAALGEFHQAEKLRFRLGPRERQAEADGFLFRAEWELNRANRSLSSSKAEAEKWSQLARADTERARDLFEQIAGFTGVAASLERLDRDSSEQKRLEEAVEQPPPLPKQQFKFAKSRSRGHTGIRRWR